MGFVQLGQSTSYVTLDNLAVLTDPALSDKTLESVLAPHRLRPSPCELEELRRIDVVLVSHKSVSACPQPTSCRCVVTILISEAAVISITSTPRPCRSWEIVANGSFHKVSGGSCGN